MGPVLIAAVATLVVIAGFKSRRSALEGVRRCRELLRRQSRDRSVARFERRPVSHHSPVVLPRCDQCGAVFDDLETLRQHAETHSS